MKVLRLPLHVDDLLAEYALGGGTSGERAEVEQHLARCPRCTRELDQIVDSFALLAEECAAPAPAPTLRNRLLASLGGSNAGWVSASNGVPS